MFDPPATPVMRRSAAELDHVANLCDVRGLKLQIDLLPHPVHDEKEPQQKRDLVLVVLDKGSELLRLRVEHGMTAACDLIRGQLAMRAP